MRIDIEKLFQETLKGLGNPDLAPKEISSMKALYMHGAVDVAIAVLDALKKNTPTVIMSGDLVCMIRVVMLEAQDQLKKDPQS